MRTRHLTSLLVYNQISLGFQLIPKEDYQSQPTYSDQLLSMY